MGVYWKVTPERPSILLPKTQVLEYLTNYVGILDQADNLHPGTASRAGHEFDPWQIAEELKGQSPCCDPVPVNWPTFKILFYMHLHIIQPGSIQKTIRIVIYSKVEDVIPRYAEITIQ